MIAAESNPVPRNGRHIARHQRRRGFSAPFSLLFLSNLAGAVEIDRRVPGVCPLARGTLLTASNAAKDSRPDTYASGAAAHSRCLHHVRFA